MVRHFRFWTPIALTTTACLAALNLYQYFGGLRQSAPPTLAISASTGAAHQPLVSPMSAEDQWVIDRYHKMFYESKTTWFPMTWLGIPLQQNPNDVWIHQEIITEVKPDYIVETGTLYGGSAALWATVLEQVNPSGRVITIDICDQAERARELPVVQRRVDFLLGSSTAPEIVAEVTGRVKGAKVLVILDSDHSKPHVLEELKAYAPLVPAGSYLIVQDTNINGHPVLEHLGPGPMEAVEEFLAANDEFVADRSRERMLFTMHPMGYLKRVK